MFRLLSFLAVAALLAGCNDKADAGERASRYDRAPRRLLQSNGSHGGYPTPAPQAYTVPLEQQYVAPPMQVQVAPPATMMVPGPSRIEKRMVEVDVVVPGEMVEVQVPLAYTAPCGPMLLEAPICPAELRQRRERRRRERVEQRRMSRSSHLGIEEPETLPQDLQPTPAE